MKNKKWLFYLILGLVFVCTGLESKATANVEFEPDFYNKYVEAIKDLPKSTPLNGGLSGDISEVMPSFMPPLSIFEIKFKEPKNKIFLPGKKILLRASLNYKYKGLENMDETRRLCLEQNDALECEMPKAYRIPELDNLGVYVQVWKRDESSADRENGDYLVSEFYALENKKLSVDQAYDFNLEWDVPGEIQSGNYYFLFFLNQDYNFNLAGNPLVVHSEGQRFDFKIKNEDGKSGVEFDKNQIKVGGRQYAYRGSALTVQEDNPVVEIPLKNLDEEAKNVVIKYDLYRWSRTDEKNLVDSKTESKEIRGNSLELLKYLVGSKPKESVYDLKISAKAGRSETLANVRFVVKERERGIFTFISFVEDGGFNTPMFCVRNASWEGKFRGKVKLTVGSEKFEQEGLINSDAGKCFVLNNKLRTKIGACAKVKGEIYDEDGELSDLRESSVSCFNEDSQKAAFADLSDISDDKTVSFLFYLVVGLATLLIVGVIIIKIKDKK